MNAPPRALVGGLCASLAQRYDIEVTLLRVAFVVLALAWGIGVLVYLGLWLGGAGRDGRQQVRKQLADVGTRLRAQLHSGPLRQRLLAKGPAVALLLGGAVVLTWSFGLLSWLTVTRALAIAALAVGLASLIGAAPTRREGR